MSIHESLKYRLKGYDYSQEGIYFITITTHKHIHFFGNVKDEQMVLNDVGKLVKRYWLEIPKHHPFVGLDTYQVMPNHIHGILVFSRKNNKNNLIEFPTLHKEIETGKYKNKFGPQSKNLSSVIRGYKAAVTKESKKINSEFRWHSRFHDHIIRSVEELERIREYIRNNPAQWEVDKLHLP